jgi:DNA helicase-2/ATP-dependent DNA helicase PcrA
MNKQEMFFRELEKVGIPLHTTQQEAVRHVEGPLVVFAGPGSGKTTVLTSRAAHLMQVAEIPPRNLLIVTFTKAAAEEMQKRLASLPGIGPLRARSCETGTFHSVFLRILLRAYGQVPQLFNEAEQRNLVRTILRDNGQDGNEEEVNDLLTKIGLCKNNLIFPEQIKAKKKENQDFKRYYQQYELVKERLQRWDYEDILVECYRLLRVRADIRDEYGKRYRYILIDEFQDANYVQYEIIKLLAVSGNLCIVGDDDQSIYRFRGSRVEYLLEFQQVFPNAKKIVLETNYRSTQQIITMAANVIRYNQKREPKLVRGTGRSGEQYQLEQPSDERAEAVKIIQLIRSQIASGQPLESFAVLYRSNAQVHTLIDELVRQSLPFSIRDAEGEFYKRWQIRDILGYFRLALDPFDLESLAQIINRPKRYIYQENWLHQLQQIARRLDGSYLNALLRLPDLESWKLRKLEQLIWDLKKISGMSPAEALRFVRKEIGYDQYLADYVTQTGQSRDQVFEPLEMLQQSVSGFRRLSDFLDHVSRINEVLQEARKTKEGIRLMTFHKAKGLEFSTVCIVGLVKGMVPHRKALKDKEQAEALEEERRLFYVGITRAKDRLYLYSPRKYNGSKVEPSPFLAEFDKKTRASD